MRLPPDHACGLHFLEFARLCKLFFSFCLADRRRIVACLEAILTDKVLPKPMASPSKPAPELVAATPKFAAIPWATIEATPAQLDALVSDLPPPKKSKNIANAVVRGLKFRKLKLDFGAFVDKKGRAREYGSEEVWLHNTFHATTKATKANKKGRQATAGLSVSATRGMETTFSVGTAPGDSEERLEGFLQLTVHIRNAVTKQLQLVIACQVEPIAAHTVIVAGETAIQRRARFLADHGTTVLADGTTVQFHLITLVLATQATLRVNSRCLADPALVNELFNTAWDAAAGLFARKFGDGEGGSGNLESWITVTPLESAKEEVATLTLKVAELEAKLSKRPTIPRGKCQKKLCVELRAQGATSTVLASRDSTIVRLKKELRLEKDARVDDEEERQTLVEDKEKLDFAHSNLKRRHDKLQVDHTELQTDRKRQARGLAEGDVRGHSLVPPVEKLSVKAVKDILETSTSTTDKLLDFMAKREDAARAASEAQQARGPAAGASITFASLRELQNLGITK